jgi:hypothetical protein
MRQSETGRDWQARLAGQMPTAKAIALGKPGGRRPSVDDLSVQKLELAASAPADIAFIGKRNGGAQAGAQHDIVGCTLEGRAEPVLDNVVPHADSG